VTDTNDDGWDLDPSAHLLPRAFVSQSSSESCCIKYSVTQAWSRRHLYISLSLSAPPAFVAVGHFISEFFV
jgi:hypothetical protein